MWRYASKYFRNFPEISIFIFSWKMLTLTKASKCRRDSDKWIPCIRCRLLMMMAFILLTHTPLFHIWRQIRVWNQQILEFWHASTSWCTLTLICSGSWERLAWVQYKTFPSNEILIEVAALTPKIPLCNETGTEPSQKALAVLHEKLNALEFYLKQRKWVAGEWLTIADFSVMATFSAIFVSRHRKSIMFYQTVLFPALSHWPLAICRHLTLVWKVQRNLHRLCRNWGRLEECSRQFLEIKRNRIDTQVVDKHDNSWILFTFVDKHSFNKKYSDNFQSSVEWVNVVEKLFNISLENCK